VAKVFANVMGILALSAGMASTAFGGQWFVEARHGIQVNGANPPNVVSAPEIDPAGALSGLTVLLGGLAVLRASRTKK
jgi:hypothetical protein